MAYLDDHPPERSQFRPRREEPSGVCLVHTAENTPDWVAFDGGAEAVARFIQGRSDPGSYHDLGDSDSSINLVRYDAEAYGDGTGSNPHAYHVSVATRADVWPLAPRVWRDGAVWQAANAAARYARWLQDRRGFLIPARRITRAQSEARMPGFISHAERDPTRRTDPGREFPWDLFLDAYKSALTEDDDMALSASDWSELNRRLVSLKEQIQNHAEKTVKDEVRRLGSYLATGKGNATFDARSQAWTTEDDTVTLADLRDLVAPPPAAG